MKKIVNKSKSNEVVFCWELAAKHLLYASSEFKEIWMKHYLLRAVSMMCSLVREKRGMTFLLFRAIWKDGVKNNCGNSY